MTIDLPAAPHCPVCGDVLAKSPRRCPRCDTPHHPECWDYVPGCAVFGCSDASPPAILEWPWAHQVLAARARLTSVVAHSMQAGILAFGAAVALNEAGQKAIVPFVVICMAVFAVALTLRVAVEAIYWFSPARRSLVDALEQGDRQLQRAIDRRVGALVPVASWKLAWALGLALLFPKFAEDCVEWWYGVGKLHPVVMFVLLLVLGALFGLVVFFPGLFLAERMIGSQRVLVNRLEASRGLPQKSS